MSDNFRIDVPFEVKSPRLKDLVNHCIMGDVWGSLLLLYIKGPKARQISTEIMFRFFILKTYLAGLNEKQIGVTRGYYRERMK